MSRICIFFLGIICIFLSSCQTAPCKNCIFERNETPVFEKIPFSDLDSSLYRVSIRLYTMYFSGLLAVKKFDDSVFRVSLISETGFKLFDMEIKNGTAEMMNVFSELDNENVLKTFKEDFIMMFPGVFPVNKCARYSHKNDNDIEYICQEENKFATHFLIDSKTGLLKKQWKTVKVKHHYFEINYGYDSSNSLTPVFITIVHSNVRLRMEFSLLEQSDVQK